VTVGDESAGDARFLLPAGGRLSRDGDGGAIATLPNTTAMQAAAPIAHRRALAHAMHRVLARTPRTRALELAARTGLRTRVLPHLTVAPGDELPAIVALAVELGAPASEWCLALSDPARDRKSAFYLFGPDGDQPAAVAKFLRHAGFGERFDNAERGLRVVAAAPVEVQRAAPRIIGRGELDGHHVLVETAATGTSLEQVLTGRSSRAEKLGAAEHVVSWLHAIAMTTAGSNGVVDEIARLHERVVARSPVTLDDAISTVSSVPSVLAHGDLWETNVLVDGDRVGVLDWDDARACGFPLWDLLHFSLNVLPLIDGARLQADRERLAIALVEGSAPSSPVFSAWIRGAVFSAWIRGAAVTLGLDDRTVGALLFLCMADWLLARERTVPGELGSWFLPRVARWWVTTVGAGWRPS
jgi:hypothetical protein